jgi:hypothetical protein
LTDRLRITGRLGGTAFKLGKLENKTEDGLLPVSELNRLRRAR